MSGSGVPVPYPTGLIDLLKPRISPKLVRYIAEADAGEFNYPAQRDAINKILRSDRIPLPLMWEPREAFALIKWVEPAGPDQAHKGFSAREMHIARAFCCACLLAARFDDQDIDTEPSDLLPRLIESVAAIDTSWLKDLRELVEWASYSCDRAQPYPQDFESDATLCRTSLVVIDAAADAHVKNDTVCQLVDEIFERKHRSFARREDQWNWLLEGNCFDQSVHLWKSLSDRYLVKPPAHWEDSDKAAAVRLGQAIIRDGDQPDG